MVLDDNPNEPNNNQDPDNEVRSDDEGFRAYTSDNIDDDSSIWNIILVVREAILPDVGADNEQTDSDTDTPQ